MCVGGARKLLPLEGLPSFACPLPYKAQRGEGVFLRRQGVSCEASNENLRDPEVSPVY